LIFWLLERSIPAVCNKQAAQKASERTEKNTSYFATVPKIPFRPGFATLHMDFTGSFSADRFCSNCAVRHVQTQRAAISKNRQPEIAPNKNNYFFASRLAKI